MRLPLETVQDSSGAKVVLASRNAIFRESLARSVSECGNMQIVAEAGTISAALEAASRSRADLAVVDATLADGDGCALATELKRACPDVKVVLLADCEDQDKFILAVRSGVEAYLVEDRPLEWLLTAIHAVLAGRLFYDPTVCAVAVKRLMSASALVPADAGELVLDLAGLSIRERQVVELVSRGMTNKEIAAELSISISTTKTHIGRIFKRLGISSRRELLPRFFKLAGAQPESERPTR